jgi:hypothetical protein
MPSLTYRVVCYVKVQFRGAWVDAYGIVQRGLDFTSACRDARDTLNECLRRNEHTPRVFVQCETIPVCDAPTVLAGRFTFMA